MVDLKKQSLPSQDEIYPKKTEPTIEIYPDSTNQSPTEQIGSKIVPTINYPFFQVTATSELSILPLPQHAIPNEFIRNVKKCYRFLNESSTYIFLITFFKFIGSFDQLKSFLTVNYPKLRFVPRTTVLKHPRHVNISNHEDLDFLHTQNRFLVAVDNKEYIYIDALSSYRRLIDEFYENN